MNKIKISNGRYIVGLDRGRGEGGGEEKGGVKLMFGHCWMETIWKYQKILMRKIVCGGRSDPGQEVSERWGEVTADRIGLETWPSHHYLLHSNTALKFLLIIHLFSQQEEEEEEEVGVVGMFRNKSDL